MYGSLLYWTVRHACGNPYGIMMILQILELLLYPYGLLRSFDVLLMYRQEGGNSIANKP